MLSRHYLRLVCTERMVAAGDPLRLTLTADYSLHIQFPGLPEHESLVLERSLRILNLPCYWILKFNGSEMGKQPDMRLI